MTDQLALDLQMPRAKRRQRVHKHSAEAYHQALPGLNSRSLLILAWLRQHGPATDRQVMRGMGFSEPNAVRPRLTELIDAGLADKALLKQPYAGAAA